MRRGDGTRGVLHETRAIGKESEVRMSDVRPIWLELYLSWNPSNEEMQTDFHAKRLLHLPTSELLQYYGDLIQANPESETFLLEIMRSNQQAIEQKAKHKFVECIEWFRRALNVWRDKYGINNLEFKYMVVELVVTCNEMAVAALKNDNYACAFNLFQTAEEFLKKRYDLDRKTYLKIMTYNNISNYFQRRYKSRAALEYLKHAKRLWQRKPSDEFSLMNQLVFSLRTGTLLSLFNKHDESQKYMTQVSRIMEQINESTQRGDFDSLQATDLGCPLQFCAHSTAPNASAPVRAWRIGSHVNQVNVVYLHNTAVNLVHTRKYGDALVYADRALEIAEAVFQGTLAVHPWSKQLRRTREVARMLTLLIDMSHAKTRMLRNGDPYHDTGSARMSSRKKRTGGGSSRKKKSATKKIPTLHVTSDIVMSDDESDMDAQAVSLRKERPSPQKSAYSPRKQSAPGDNEPQSPFALAEKRKAGRAEHEESADMDHDDTLEETIDLATGSVLTESPFKNTGTGAEGMRHGNVSTRSLPVDVSDSATGFSPRGSNAMGMQASPNVHSAGVNTSRGHSPKRVTRNVTSPSLIVGGLNIDDELDMASKALNDSANYASQVASRGTHSAKYKQRLAAIQQGMASPGRGLSGLSYNNDATPGAAGRRDRRSHHGHSHNEDVSTYDRRPDTRGEQQDPLSPFSPNSFTSSPQHSTAGTVAASAGTIGDRGGSQMRTNASPMRMSSNNMQTGDLGSTSGSGHVPQTSVESSNYVTENDNTFERKLTTRTQGSTSANVRNSSVGELSPPAQRIVTSPRAS